MKNLVPYPVRVEFHRAARWMADRRSPAAIARGRATDLDLYRHELIGHESKLLRAVSPDLMPLQAGKVHNLALAASRLNGTILQAGDVFSFCATVGRTTRRKGYVNGLEMHEGRLMGAPGGGLCQMANMLYWMALHLDLEIVERHRHELDMFADDDRRVPFGMGATVFYNYRDLRLRNTLDQRLVLSISVDPPVLRGQVLSDREKPFDAALVETMHRFVRRPDGTVWRENRVMRRITYRDGRAPIEREIAHNLGRVCYEVPESCIEAPD